MERSKIVKLVVSIALILFSMSVMPQAWAAAEGDMTVLRAAHRGDVNAMRRIGRRMYRGCSVGDRSTGIQWLEKAAGKGDAEAMYCLGRIYQSKGSEKLAAEYLEKAVKEGHAKAASALEKLSLEYSCACVIEKAKSGSYRACMRLLKAYLIGGDGVNADINEAFKWYKQAATMKEKETRETLKKWNASQTVPMWEELAKNKEDEEALMHLAELYSQGVDGLPKDEEKAKQYYKEAATAGNLQAVAWLKEKGVPFETKAERDARIAREREEVQRKLQESQEVLYDGLHAYIFRKIESAKEKLRQAAEVGNVDAQAVLAHILKDGTQREKLERIELLKKAAEQEHPYATYEVAGFYASGKEEGFPKDEGKARELLDKAAQKGSCDAATLMCGHMASNGDMEGAIEYADMFAQKYDATSQGISAILAMKLLLNDHQERDKLAMMMEGGSIAAIRWLAGIRKSPEERCELYTLAMNKRDAEATYRLGLLLEKIDGNDRRSSTLIESAADMGFVRAMNVWGVMLLNRREYERAISYFKKAAEHGSPSALQSLALGDVSPEESRKLLLRAYMLFLLRINTDESEKEFKENESVIRKFLPPYKCIPQKN